MSFSKAATPSDVVGNGKGAVGTENQREGKRRNPISERQACACLIRMEEVGVAGGDGAESTQQLSTSP